jgi:hypothetical protein
MTVPIHSLELTATRAVARFAVAQFYRYMR